MKIEKNKIVFAAVLATILLFLISYAIMLSSDKEHNDKNLRNIKVPTLGDTEPEYDSKLDALNDLKEVRERNAPSIYDEKFIDSLGYLDPDLEKKEKQWYVDSLIASEEMEKLTPARHTRTTISQIETASNNTEEVKEKQKIALKEMSLEHQLFFASSPKREDPLGYEQTDSVLCAVVDGDQVVRRDSRVKMRLNRGGKIQGEYFSKNTLVYGLISFKSNRVAIEIKNFGRHFVDLRAFDFQDHLPGIYVENNFRADVSNELLGDVVDDISIAGVPQISGIKNIFQRNNRNVKVTLLNNYRLILKPEL